MLARTGNYFVYFFLSFLLYSSCCVCRLDWLDGLCCKEDHESHDAFITSNNSINNNGGKSNKKKITHENLFIIGDVEKCKEVMEKLGADSCSEQNGITIYNKEIIDNKWHNTFKFYLCGNGVVECEKIYQNDNERSSYFFFFVDIKDSESLNNLIRYCLPEFKKIFEMEIYRFFLILLKTDSQEIEISHVQQAKEIAVSRGLKYFGVIDSQNMTWDFEEDKQEYFDIIGEFESEAETEHKNDYKFGKMNWNTCVYEVQEKNNIWGMFLCGVNYDMITDEIIRKEIKYQNLFKGLPILGYKSKLSISNQGHRI